MAPMHSYCIIHPASEPNGKFQYDSRSVTVEVPSSDSSGDPYDEALVAGTERETLAFDHVFPPKTSQEEIFEKIALSHVKAFAASFQSAIFMATGATGSGKTFAVTGGAQKFSDRGLIPRSVSALFEALAAHPDRDNIEVSVSFYELYKDAVIDLLSERRRKVPIKATEQGPQLVGLLRQAVSTESDAYHLLFQGDSNRHFQSFAQNAETSRGHVFYLLHIRRSGQRAVLAFADLAAPIAVRNPANSAIAQSLDALKATLLALRDGREAFWESSVLPQLLEPWLSPDSDPSVILLSPVCYSAEMHPEVHEWLSFTRLAQEAKSGRRLPYSRPLQTNWGSKGLPEALQVPASFQGVEKAEDAVAKVNSKPNSGRKEETPHQPLEKKVQPEPGPEGPRVEPPTTPKVTGASSPAVTPPVAMNVTLVSPGAGARTPLAGPVVPPKSPRSHVAPVVPAQAARSVSPMRAPQVVGPCRDPTIYAALGRVVAPQPQVSPAQMLQRPSTLAVQHQQREMQYLQNWKQHAHSVHSHALQLVSPSPGNRNAHLHGRPSGPKDPPTEQGASGYASPMMPTATRPWSNGPKEPEQAASGYASPMPTAFPRSVTPLAYARSESPMALHLRTASPMAKQVPVVRYAMAAVPLGAVVMNGREVARPQVPVAFKVAPPSYAQVKEPSRSTSPLPAGTMERVRARQESK